MAAPYANPWNQFGGTTGAFTPASGATQASGTTSTSSSSASSSMGTASIIMSAAGAISSVIGAFYAADLAKIQAESAASTLEYQQAIAEINAQVAELNAQQALYAGERQIGMVTMEYGQKKSAARASMAARGVTLGAGSAQEVIATNELMKEVDTITINANAVRAAEAARMQKVGFEAEALMSDTYADMTRTQAEAISPWASAASSLLSGGAKVADTWYRMKPPASTFDYRTASVG